jgi:DNA-binding NarL/FixJ family response regulator
MRPGKFMSEDSPVRVLLVDDHKVVRVGLRTLLSDSPMVQVVGEAGTIQQALTDCARLSPDVVLMDIRLPDGNGVEGTRRIKELLPATRVLILTSYADDETILKAIDAGADGYLLKEVENLDLAAALVHVARGGAMLDPAVARRLLDEHRAGSVSRKPALSAQEQQLLELVSRGRTNKEIAADLELGEHTVRNYLSRLYQKMSVSNRAQAVAVHQGGKKG